MILYKYEGMSAGLSDEDLINLVNIVKIRAKRCYIVRYDYIPRINVIINSRVIYSGLNSGSNYYRIPYKYEAYVHYRRDCDGYEVLYREHSSERFKKYIISFGVVSKQLRDSCVTIGEI